MFNRFYRLEIHSLMVGIFNSACELCLHGRRNYTVLVYCCLSTFSLTSPPLPKLNVQCIQTLWGCGEGGGRGMLCCAVDHILQEFYTVFLVQNLQNCFTTPNKMTSKDDINGLVSLKFLRPWVKPSKDKYVYPHCNPCLSQLLINLAFAPAWAWTNYL